MDERILYAVLALEVLLRSVLEVHEKRLFGKMIPLWLCRIVPILNDFAPYPENPPGEPNKKFVDAHEAAHKKLHHALLRNLCKLCFFILLVLAILVMLGSWRIPLWQIVLWAHVILAVVRPLYHRLCWSQEYEADKLAAQAVGAAAAKRELERLQRAERQVSPFFALAYREHPPAYGRRSLL